MTRVQLTESEALEWLESAARKVPADQAIVELGVYQGSSLARLAAGSKAGNRAPVFGIDPWGLPGAYPDRPHMVRRYGPGNQRVARRAVDASGAGDLVELVRDFSWSAGARWSGPPVGLLFVDAQHTEAAVLIDHAAWAPHLAPDAVIAYDDFCPRFPGVVAAVKRLHGDRFRLVGTRLAVAAGR